MDRPLKNRPIRPEPKSDKLVRIRWMFGGYSSKLNARWMSGWESMDRGVSFAQHVIAPAERCTGRPPPGDTNVGATDSTHINVGASIRTGSVLDSLLCTPVPWGL
jgi:hypothetical protein